MIDPSVQVMTEADLRAPRLMPGGLCFICGTWIDHEQQEAYRVMLEDAEGERQEFLAHGGCLSEVAHPSSALKKAIARPPDPPAEADGAESAQTPEAAPAADALDPKPFTPEGR
jgi:hypothetical protein